MGISAHIETQLNPSRTHGYLVTKEEQAATTLAASRVS